MPLEVLSAPSNPVVRLGSICREHIFPADLGHAKCSPFRTVSVMAFCRDMSSSYLKQLEHIFSNMYTYVRIYIYMYIYIYVYILCIYIYYVYIYIVYIYIVYI